MQTRSHTGQESKASVSTAAPTSPFVVSNDRRGSEGGCARALHLRRSLARYCSASGAALSTVLTVMAQLPQGVDTVDRYVKYMAFGPCVDKMLTITLLTLWRTEQNVDSVDSVDTIYGGKRHTGDI